MNQPLCFVLSRADRIHHCKHPLYQINQPYSFSSVETPIPTWLCEGIRTVFVELPLHHT